MFNSELRTMRLPCKNMSFRNAVVSLKIFSFVFSPPVVCGYEFVRFSFKKSEFQLINIPY